MAAQQTMIRPAQIDALPFLDAQQKQQYRNGLAQLWTQFEAAPEGSAQKQETRQRIVTASTRIMQQISQRTRPANNQPRQPGQNNVNPAANNMQPQQPQNPQIAQQRPPQQVQPQQPAQPGQDVDAQIKDRLTIEVNRVVVAPPENCTNQQQFELYKQNFKSQLGSFRFKTEKAKHSADLLQKQIQAMQASGQQNGQLEDLQNKLAQYKNAAFTFSQQAQTLMETNKRNMDAAQARKNQRPDQPRPPTAQPGVPNQQDTASPVQPPRPTTGQGQQPRAMPQPTPIQQPQRPPQQGQQYPQQYPNGPNSAGPQNVQQRPHALSQQGAIAKAQEQNTQQNSTPQSATQGSMPFNQGMVTPTSALPQSNSQISAKFPIPKNLPINPQSHAAVPAGPSRPTNHNHGMMGAPGIQKAPQFNLDSDGDHVVSSRKLNELVRQVTGSADPADGLAPEVEEAVLAMTDNFVDDVITRACQLAKLRQGSTLDIRDVQLVLERNYGLRIPGYSLDETRTVRKFNPSPNWVAKVQSVQASKLTRGE